MKEITTKLYSFNELSNEAKEKVIEHAAKQIQSDPWDYTLEECITSLKAIANALTTKITNYEIGAYNRHNYCTIDFDMEPAEALTYFIQTMERAGYPIISGAPRFNGECKFTGVCYDEDIAEEIYKQLVADNTMQSAFNSAAERIGRICEEDLEYRTGKEGILENLDTTEEIYTETGHIF